MKIIKDKILNDLDYYTDCKFVRCLNLGADLKNCIWENGTWIGGKSLNLKWKGGVWKNWYYTPKGVFDNWKYGTEFKGVKI